MSSPSTKKNYKACNYRHYLTKVKGEKGIESCHARHGRQAHAFLEEYGRECVARKLRSSPALFQEILNRWDEHPNITPEDKDDLHLAVWRVRETLEFEPNTQFELKFAFTADWSPCDFNDPNRIYRGVIDRIVVHDRTHVTIRDYKTGWGKKGYPEQLSDYALPLFFWMPDVEVVHTGWDFTRNGLYTDGPEFRRADVKDLFRRFVADLAEMNTPRKVWEPNGLGAECAKCDVPHKCVHFQEMVRSGLAGEDLEGIIKIYQRQAVCKAQAGLDEAAVKIFAKANGMIHLPGGKIYTNIPKEGVKLAPRADPKDFLARALKAGLTYEDFISAIDITAGQDQKVLDAAEKKGAPRAFFKDLVIDTTRADWREAEPSEVRTGVVDAQIEEASKAPRAKKGKLKVTAPSGEAWMLDATSVISNENIPDGDGNLG